MKHLLAKLLNPDWWYATIVRMIRTFAQVALMTIATDQLFFDIQWRYMIGMALTSAFLSFLTSLATTLPEVGYDGELIINKNGSEKDIYRLDLDLDFDTIDRQRMFKLKVREEEPSQE